MSASQPEWVWNDRLQTYWYYDAQSRQCITTDGRRFQAASEAGASSSREPRDIPTTARVTQAEAGSYQCSPANQGSPTQRPAYLASNLGSSAGSRTSQPALGPTYPAIAGSLAFRNRSDSNRPSGSLVQPAAQDQSRSEQQYAPSTFSQTGSEAPRTTAVLNEGYKKRDQSRKFFIIGRVFLTLWFEPMGEIKPKFNSVATDRETLPGKFGEKSYSDIRRFVIIREGELSCTALPVRTYGSQGAALRKDQAENGIIYMGEQVPPRPIAEPKLLQYAIRVDPDKSAEKLDPLSRINYGTVYTIEHNIKVRPCGMVNREHIPALLTQFRAVFVSKIGQRANQAPTRIEADDLGKSHAAQGASVARHVQAAEYADRLRTGRSRDYRQNARTDVVHAQEQEVEGSNELAELTSQDRQQLRDIFGRAFAVLLKQGYSKAEAEHAAKTVVSTEVTKMVSNARERSQASDSRKTQTPRTSANTLLGGSSTGPSSSRMTAEQGRRPLPTQAQSVGLRQSHLAAGPSTIQSLQGQGSLATAAGPALAGIPSIENLTEKGWSEADAVAYRELLTNGWRPTSAQTILNLLHGGMPTADAANIARLVESGSSLAAATARVRGCSGTGISTRVVTKGKGKIT